MTEKIKLVCESDDCVNANTNKLPHYHDVEDTQEPKAQQLEIRNLSIGPFE